MYLSVESIGYWVFLLGEMFGIWGVLVVVG